MKFTDGIQLELQTISTHHILHGKTPQCSNDFRLNNFYLTVKKWRINSNFFRKRVTVLGRAIFNYIGHIDILPFNTNGSQKFVKHLPRPPTKGPARLRFIFPGCFADKHYFSRVVALPDYRKIFILYPLGIERRRYQSDDLVFNLL